MAVGRTTQVTIGADTFDISTKLHTGDIPTIETLVSNQGQIVFRTSLPIEDLKPVFAHSEEILRRVEAQHAAVLDEIRVNGRLAAPSLAPTPNDARKSTEHPLERALSHMGNKDFQLAESELRRLLDGDSSYAEAEELLEIVRASGSQKNPPVTSLSDRLRAGAEALTRGWKSSAIQNWARGLSADPSNRIFQLLVLLTTTPSPERRTRYLQELLEISKDLLGGDRSEEAHALLLALQAIENPKGASPQPSGAVQESQAPSSSSSSPTTRRHLKPTDTQPTGFAPDQQEDAGSSPTKQDSIGEESFGNHRLNPLDVEGAEVADSADDGEHDAHLAHPEREAALVEASRAEWEAAQKERPLPSRSSLRDRSRHGMWARLGTRKGIALSAVGGLVFLMAALLVLWPGVEEEGREEVERAASLVATGQFRQAILVYDQVVARGQFQTVAYLGRGRARLAAGEAEAGLLDLARAAELAPDSVEILQELADGLYSRGRFEDAVEYYGHTIALGRDSADVRYRLAASLVQLNRAEEALPHLEAAIARETSHGEARYLYGKLLNDFGRYAEAEKEIRGARTRFDPGADYFVELGIALLEQGKLDGAEELARQLEREDPSDARAHTLLGEVYLGRQRLEASRNELIVALQTNSEQPRAHLALARVWLAFGQSNKDPGDLLKARQILAEGHGIPESKRLLALGEVSFAEGNPEGAIELLEQALAQGCERLPAQLALAEARFAAGDLAGAAEELEAADILAPGDAAIALSLGLIHSQRKDFPFASKEYLKALHRVGLTQPVHENSGPVILPAPYLALPPRFDVDRVIRDTYRRALAQNEDDEIAAALKGIAESTSFLIGGPA
jgi:tetratricopeptide (TPR) repeat protein